MFRILIRIRYLATVVVVLLAVHALGLLTVGAIRTYEAYHMLWQGPSWQGEDRPGIHIAESIDALLFALLLIVLASGTAGLFLTGPGKGVDSQLPDWMRVKNLTELKLLLWEGSLMVLVVASMTTFIANVENPHWLLLVLPAAILLLSVSYYLMKRATREQMKG